MRDWIELAAIIAILVVDALLLHDSRAMLHLYEGYFAERKQARKAAVTRWRGKGNASTTGTTSGHAVVVESVVEGTAERGATE